MGEEISLETIIARREDLLLAELDDNELVMLNIKRGAYYGVDETAKAIWDCLSVPCSVAAVVDHLLTCFAVDRQTCERETLAFVNEMLKDELVHMVDGT